MKTQHSPGPWRVQSDPLLSKSHPLHENRYVTTDHAMETWRSESAIGHGDDCAGFCGDGSIICKLMDSHHQKSDAKLIAAAPTMLRALQSIVAVLDGRQPRDAAGALMIAQSAIKAVDGTLDHAQFFADASRTANNRV